jgi:hypothetical protein
MILSVFAIWSRILWPFGSVGSTGASSICVRITFLLREAYTSTKETFDLKLKSIKNKLPLPLIIRRSINEDVLLRQLKYLGLLKDLIKIKKLL